jgi:hypothetical protein
VESLNALDPKRPIRDETEAVDGLVWKISSDKSLYQNRNPTAGSDNLSASELEPWVFFWAMPAALLFLRIVVWLARNKTPGSN